MYPPLEHVANIIKHKQTQTSLCFSKTTMEYNKPFTYSSADVCNVIYKAFKIINIRLRH